MYFVHAKRAHKIRSESIIRIHGSLLAVNKTVLGARRNFFAGVEKPFRWQKLRKCLTGRNWI